MRLIDSQGIKLGAWFLARPIAHRGLHDRSVGAIENSMTAFKRAVESGYAIELDVQPSADGDPMVFHDPTLDRLTEAHGVIDALSTEHLSKIALLGTDDRVVSLETVLKAIGGTVPVFVELKSDTQDESLKTQMAKSTACLAAQYRGRVAVMSYDPSLITSNFFNAPRGVIVKSVADRQQVLPEYAIDFCSVDKSIYKNKVIQEARSKGLPVITWTIISEKEAQDAVAWVEQITFERFFPGVMV